MVTADLDDRPWIPALEGLAEALGDAQPLRARGRVSSLVGLGLEARVPGVRLGELVEVRRLHGEPLLAEVVGFHGADATLMPLGRTEGVSPEDEVVALGRPLQVTCGDGLLGRVLDGLGEGRTERAWTLTGPYGVGKSAFVVMLRSCLLS